MCFEDVCVMESCGVVFMVDGGVGVLVWIVDCVVVVEVEGDDGGIFEIEGGVFWLVLVEV